MSLSIARLGRWLRRYALVIDIVALTLLWHFAAVNAGESVARFLPTPYQVIDEFVIQIQGEMASHAIASARRVLISIGVGVVTAAPLAILTAQFHLLDLFVTPLMYFAYPAPKVVFLPLIILFFGLGDESRIVLIVLIIFFQVFVIIRDAASQVHPETLESISSLGAGHWQKLRYVYIPVSIPATMTALKISTGTAIAVLFIAESIAGRNGLGYYIINEWNRFRYTNMYAGILAMSLLGLVLFATFEGLERHFTRWQRP